MKLLHVDAGITGRASVSRQLSAALVAALTRANPDLQVVRRDLDAAPLPHLDSGNIAGLGKTEGETPDGGLSGAVLREFLDADIIVLGAPMYNFGIPRPFAAEVEAGSAQRMV